MKRRVVVTGWGILTSLSCEVDDCWNRVVNGESGIHDIKLCDVSDIKVTIGGDLHDWSCRDLVGSKEEKKLDRFSQFAIVGAEDAMKSSGLNLESESDLTRFGSVLGSGIGGMATITEQMERLVLKGPKRVSPLTIPKLMLNAGGGNIAIRYGLRGPNYSIATACASAANAMGNSLVHIQNGTSDVMVTGGSEAAMTRMGVSAFANMRALSNRTDDPTKASRPFDLDRDGFVFSEGAGILIFEELDRAKARGADILAEVAGFGTSCDAGHITSPDEQGVGAAQAMQAALDDAELNPENIDYINAHGTSTPLGDKAETRAIKTVFKDHALNVSISSTKSQLGHSLGASGGIELILAIKAIRDGVVPPTINLDTPDPECDLDYTPNEARERKLTYAMSNSFGFGGHNASVIVKKFEG
jgi:3-oxoacyl-[acyl-carrier-protein] synthase II